MSKLDSIPLSLVDIFSPDKATPSVGYKVKHFVNHHSFLMLYENGFSFNREWGEYFVDGLMLRQILNIFAIKHVYEPGPVYLRNRLKNTLPETCFFALPNERTAKSLEKLGFHNHVVLPLIDDTNISVIAQSIVAAVKDRLLIIGIGSPNQDILAQKIVMQNSQLEVVCVGAAVEFLAGTQKSTPELMRRAGVEWLWRLITNFRVTMPRVTSSAVRFLALLLRAKVKP